jgi:mRNA interferase YafQ
MLLWVANDSPLPPEYLDHELTGEWARFRECHIGGDFLAARLLNLRLNSRRNLVVEG